MPQGPASGCAAAALDLDALLPHAGPMRLITAVRAWDEAGQTQPAAPDDTWNYKGYLSAAWHRVHVTVV